MDSWSDRRREEGTEEEEEERIRNMWLRQRDQHVQRPGEERTDWGLLVPSGSGLPQSVTQCWFFHGPQLHREGASRDLGKERGQERDLSPYS